MEVYTGEKSIKVHGSDTWFLEEKFAAVKVFMVLIKGPLTTLLGGGAGYSDFGKAVIAQM